jgi:peroxiredoxin family protein
VRDPHRPKYRVSKFFADFVDHQGQMVYCGHVQTADRLPGLVGCCGMIALWNPPGGLAKLLLAIRHRPELTGQTHLAKHNQVVRQWPAAYGLALLKKDLKPNISPPGNPAMPMKMPFGPQWFQGIEWNMPNLLMAGVPGFENLATSLMKMTVKNHGVASIPELRDLCIEADVKMVACQMTVHLFGMADRITVIVART